MDTGQSSGADADIEDGPNPDALEDDENIKASPLAKRFAKIYIGDYRASMQFISEHPQILTERNSDSLLVEAFDAQLEGKDKYAKQCVNQALLIQYCRQLGKDGVGLFFKRITTRDHQAQRLFMDDVNSTYGKIRERAAVIAKERAEHPEGESGDREQIQLHAVDPNTTINIVVPPPVPTNLGAASSVPPPTEDQIEARRIFETFPPGLQKALESGSLDEVNKVLGKMSVSEAEEVVEKLGEGGMLSLEEGVIDATNEEGKKLVEEIERTHRMPGQEGQVVEMSEDPPLD
jgi:cell division cycle protein 37